MALYLTENPARSSYLPCSDHAGQKVRLRDIKAVVSVS
jgi:hypothetical protein